MKWGVRRDGHEVGNSKKKAEHLINGSLINKMKKTSVHSYKKPNIEAREREVALHYLMTDMTRDQRAQHVISKPVGDYVYTFEKKSEGVYDIIHKKRI